MTTPMTKIVLQNRKANPDVIESLQAKTDLEDELYSQLGQLEALCAAQLTLATEGLHLEQPHHLNYCQALRHYVGNVKQIAERLFS
jgi:hypothetical protein